MFGNEADKRMPVTMTLVNGSILRGSVPAGASASLAFELNRDGTFLNFKTSTGQIVFVAKSTIAQVSAGNEEKKASLPELIRGQSPYKVLRVSDAATPEMIRQSYLALAKIYHPDNFVAETTAPEVYEYVNDMFQQITMAYSSLKDLQAQAA